MFWQSMAWLWKHDPVFRRALMQLPMVPYLGWVLYEFYQIDQVFFVVDEREQLKLLWHEGAMLWPIVYLVLYQWWRRPSR